MSDSTQPVKGNAVQIDGAFYTVTDILPSLDGDLVECVNVKAVPAHFIVKSADLVEAGDFAGVTVWKKK